MTKKRAAAVLRKTAEAILNRGLVNNFGRPTGICGVAVSEFMESPSSFLSPYVYESPDQYWIFAYPPGEELEARVLACYLIALQLED